jgi:hypothetical protein
MPLINSIPTHSQASPPAPFHCRRIGQKKHHTPKATGNALITQQDDRVNDHEPCNAVEEQRAGL